MSTVHGEPLWRSLYGGYTEHGVFSPVVVWRGFSSTRMRWLVGPVPFGASSSLSCGLCIECCVLHDGNFSCVCLLAIVGDASPTRTGCPPSFPTNTHTSGAVLSTFKCKLLARAKARAGTTRELRAIGVSGAGSPFDIRVKSHYVRKDTVNPTKVAYYALDELIAAEAKPPKKRAPRKKRK